jgi:hypothetical protein
MSQEAEKALETLKLFTYQNYMLASRERPTRDQAEQARRDLEGAWHYQRSLVDEARTRQAVLTAGIRYALSLLDSGEDYDVRPILERALDTP